MKSIQPYSIHVIGGSVLKVQATPIAEITDEIRGIAERMIATMFAFNGIGLAAPQVGISLRLITLALPHSVTGGAGSFPEETFFLQQMPLALVNPHIVLHCGETEMRKEGCLSIPGIYGHVERPAKIVIEAQKLDGSQLIIECRGLSACCIQHEIDHLNGTLFVTKVIPEENYEIRRKADKLEQRYGMMNNYIRTNP